MTVWCSQCEKWSELPTEMAGIDASVSCEHCGAIMQIESRYALCPDCGRYHRRGYEVCPFVVEGMEVSVVGVSASGPDGYSVEAQKRRTRKRSDEYYWQLYIDYRDRATEPEPLVEVAEEVEVEPSGRAAEPPHPADMPEYVMEGDSSTGRNGNGWGAPGNGHVNENGNGHSNGHTNGHANGKSNGYSNGNGNGYSNGSGNGNGYGYGKGQRLAKSRPGADRERAGDALPGDRERGGGRARRGCARESGGGQLQRVRVRADQTTRPAWRRWPRYWPRRRSSASTPRRPASTRTRSSCCYSRFLLWTRFIS